MLGAILGTQTAGGALIRVDITWPDIDLGSKVAGLSFQGQKIGVAENLDIGRPTGLN